MALPGNILKQANSPSLFTYSQSWINQGYDPWDEHRPNINGVWQMFDENDTSSYSIVDTDCPWRGMNIDAWWKHVITFTQPTVIGQLRLVWQLYAPANSTRRLQRVVISGYNGQQKVYEYDSDPNMPFGHNIVCDNVWTIGKVLTSFEVVFWDYMTGLVNTQIIVYSIEANQAVDSRLRVVTSTNPQTIKKIAAVPGDIAGLPRIRVPDGVYSLMLVPTTDSKALPLRFVGPNNEIKAFMEYTG